MISLMLSVLIASSTSWALRPPPIFNTGKLISSEGFILEYSKTPWVRKSTNDFDEDKNTALFKLKSPEEQTASFTVRVDKQTSTASLKEYSDKWLKNFSQYGLEVLGHQKFKNKNDIPGIVIDLFSENSRKKIRQVIFYRDSKAFVLTCMDQQKLFKDTLKSCNELIETFNWHSEEASPEHKISI